MLYILNVFLLLSLQLLRLHQIAYYDYIFINAL